MKRPPSELAAGDARHMLRCLELAEAYRGWTSPNPMVGCVIVGADGQVLAEGAHEGPGKRHAEIVALDKLGRTAKGATLYLNLEPCTHHGRTPPCAPVVRDAGLARVVIGTADPVPGHGGGIRLLRRAGIAVTVGVERAACERSNRAFLTWGREGRPLFTLKAAITLDGKIATARGESKWITGPRARAEVMALRHELHAVLAGIGTVLADDPQLTVRGIDGRDPHRIILDSKLRTPPAARLLRTRTDARTIIATTAKAPVTREKALVARGAEVWRVPARRDGRLDLQALAARLGAEGITGVLVEGGGEVHASFLEARLADRLVIYVAPKIVGGPGKSWVGGRGVARLSQAWEFELEGASTIGADLRVTLDRVAALTGPRTTGPRRPSR